MPRVETCPVQPGFRATSCRHCVRKHWLPVNQCVGNKPRSRRASVLFHPVITCAAGKQHGIVRRIQTAEGMFFSAVRVIVPLQRKQKKGSESHEGFSRLNSESTFWCARWIISRVWPLIVRPLRPARVSSSSHLTLTQTVETLTAGRARCGVCTLSIQAHLIQPPRRRSSGSSEMVSSALKLQSENKESDSWRGIHILTSLPIFSLSSDSSEHQSVNSSQNNGWGVLINRQLVLWASFSSLSWRFLGQFNSAQL